MKTISLLLTGLLLAVSHATAQITIEVVTDQDQFLLGESLPVAVKITNRSGRQLHLGAEADWLTFSVESSDGFVVIKKSEVPVVGAFELESSQEATKRVDIAPSFVLGKPGRYKIIASLRVKELSAQTASAPKTFDIINGAKLWSQEFGVPATNGTPEMRKYTLEQASYLRAQMRLYVQLSDAAESRVIKTRALGSSVSFSRPEAQVDRLSVLHVLWQTGAQSFNYCVVDPGGDILRRDIFDDFNTRPRLTVNESGDVQVIGGVKRAKPGEIPKVKLPVETSVTNSAAPVAK
ncbi:MAG: hypothetical protein RL616_1369 [Verrucomicrobiota bacterium]